MLSGRGIGMSAVRDLVRESGGDIEVVSKAGEGRLGPLRCRPMGFTSSPDDDDLPTAFTRVSPTRRCASEWPPVFCFNVPHRLTNDHKAPDGRFYPEVAGVGVPFGVEDVQAIGVPWFQCRVVGQVIEVNFARPGRMQAAKSRAKRPLTKTQTSSSPRKVKRSPPLYSNLARNSVVKWKLWLRPWLPKPRSSNGKNDALS